MDLASKSWPTVSWMCLQDGASVKIGGTRSYNIAQTTGVDDMGRQFTEVIRRT